MRIKLFRPMISLLLMAVFSSAYSQENKNEPKFRKEKSYSKSYSVSGSDKITLDNQFGELKLNTWDKNEVKVEATITGMSDEEARAQQIMDRISISDEKSAGGVSFHTNIDDDKNDHKKEKNNNHVNEGMKINMTVFLPAGNPLIAKNQFGAMIVPDYRGEATLESRFGSLTAGKITNAKNISVSFGKANIAQVTNGKIMIEYSSGTISKLTGNADIKVQFSSPVKINVDNDVKSLTIDNSYSTLYLDLSKNLSANYNISTNYGSLKNETAFKIEKEGKDDDHGVSFEKKYSGTSGGGGTKVSISSSFGTVTLGHDLKVDMSKKKNKE